MWSKIAILQKDHQSSDRNKRNWFYGQWIPDDSILDTYYIHNGGYYNQRIGQFYTNQLMTECCICHQVSISFFFRYLLKGSQTCSTDEKYLIENVQNLIPRYFQRFLISNERDRKKWFPRHCSPK